MRPVNLWFFCISVLWKSNCKEYCQGSARQLHALPASTWHHLGSAWPTNFSPWHRLSVSFSSKLRFFFFLLSFKKAVSPAAQQLCNKEVCQVMSDQTNDGWPTLHACTVHSGVSVFKKKIWKREFVSHKKSILGLKKDKLIVRPLESSSWVAVMFRRGVCVSSSEWHSFMHTAVYVTSGWCFSLPKCGF